jgi:hypothetical protein
MKSIIRGCLIFKSTSERFFLLLLFGKKKWGLENILYSKGNKGKFLSEGVPLHSFFFFILGGGGWLRGGRLMNSESCSLDGRTWHVMWVPTGIGQMPLREARAEISKYPK